MKVRVCRFMRYGMHGLQLSYDVLRGMVARYVPGCSLLGYICIVICTANYIACLVFNGRRQFAAASVAYVGCPLLGGNMYPMRVLYMGSLSDIEVYNYRSTVELSCLHSFQRPAAKCPEVVVYFGSLVLVLLWFENTPHGQLVFPE